MQSTQILDLVNAFSGEISGYLTSKRHLKKLLFANYGVEREDALCSQFNPSVVDVIDKRKCVFDPHHVILSLYTKESTRDALVTEDVPISKSHSKVDLAPHAVVKPNGKRYLLVKSVSVGGHVITRDVKYLLSGQDRVSPSINADALVIHGGFVSVRLVGGRYSVEIPITEHLVISEAKTDQG